MNIIQVFKLFPTQDSCIEHLESVRWKESPICPYCGAINNSTPAPKEQRHHCNGCKTTFSVTVRTIFHHTHLPLQKWFLAISLVLNARKGISARQLARDLEINKSTAWRMGMQIRKARSEGEQRQLLQGVVEMDETYVGGKPRKGSGKGGISKRGGGTDKTPVVGMVERGGKVIAKSVKKSKLDSKNLSALVRQSVDTQNSVLITDKYRGYFGIKRFMPHQTINHQLWYVNGDIHTNTIEGFWALLKRGIVGQYHKVSLRHLPKYLDEFCYRYNNRNNIDVFNNTISRALGVN